MTSKDAQGTYLEFSDPAKGSHKFYEVVVEAATVTTRFGRIGTAGQVKVENYQSEREATQAAEAKISEKLAKGYEASVKGLRGREPIRKAGRLSLDEQMKNLAACGISLSPGLSKETLLSQFEQDDFEREPYLLLLAALGGETEEEPIRPLSIDIWHFDTECIEGPGSYVNIAERLRVLAGADLPLEEVRDDVDEEKGVAWLAFKLGGRLYHWDLQVESDWVDTEVFSAFDALLQGRGTGKRFTYLDLGGQDCLIGCSTPERLEELKATTNLDFRWMTD